MNALAIWCSKNFMVLNAIKSAGIVFGPIPQVLPPFKFGTEHVSIDEKQTYVGFTVLSTSHNIFKLHYDIKGEKQRRQVT